jgi:SAM-dependent methyltransferase
VNGWLRAYREEPERFDWLARAEDPDGAIVAALRRHGAWQGGEVLELGCGTARFSPALAAGSARWTGLDRAPAMLRLARPRAAGAGIRLVRAEAESLPFPAGSFDAVVATWLLGDLSGKRRGRALAECDRVLRPGGAVWLAENAGDAEFDALEGGRDTAWAAPAGCTVAERVETELRFADEAEAAATLGFLLGPAAAAELAARPRSRVGHAVLILRRLRRTPSPS